jgi:hypothetical protein
MITTLAKVSPSLFALAVAGMSLVSKKLMPASSASDSVRR